jgi:hypothetical protein
MRLAHLIIESEDEEAQEHARESADSSDRWFFLRCPCGQVMRGILEFEGIGGRRTWGAPQGPDRPGYKAPRYWCDICGRVAESWKPYRIIDNISLDEDAKGDYASEPEYMVYNGTGTWCVCGSKKTPAWAVNIGGIGDRAVWDIGTCARGATHMGCYDCGRVATLKGKENPETRWYYYEVVDRTTPDQS